MLQRKALTAEEATFKASLIAWAMSDFNVFASTARVTESQGHRTIKIGGIGNADGKIHLFRFVHPDAQYGDVRLTIVGTQTGGFKLNFKPDDSGNMDLEITAQASDTEGTLILLDEEVLGDTVKASGLTVSSAAGSTSGKTKLTVTPTLGVGNSYRYMTRRTDSGSRCGAVRLDGMGRYVRHYGGDRRYSDGGRGRRHGQGG